MHKAAYTPNIIPCIDLQPITLVWPYPKVLASLHFRIDRTVLWHIVPIRIFVVGSRAYS